MKIDCDNNMREDNFSIENQNNKKSMPKKK